jgi:hypothetical protein
MAADPDVDLVCAPDLVGTADPGRSRICRPRWSVTVRTPVTAWPSDGVLTSDRKDVEDQRTALDGVLTGDRKGRRRSAHRAFSSDGALYHPGCG